ncbi:hypothetical protein E2C01_034438 [Portunus trituberculatus]|uniref:Uncharacterized protein n=1 Tax=Portunus trituberculatus TaxID=210409 RepID=A0A5B7F5J4_PORTR|nr:hypothetical protein [Portunus trituberculatus]
MTVPDLTLGYRFLAQTFTPHTPYIERKWRRERTFPTPCPYHRRYLYLRHHCPSSPPPLEDLAGWEIGRRGLNEPFLLPLGDGA